MTSKVLATLTILAAAALSGCMGIGNTGPDFGYLDLRSFAATSTYDTVTGMAHVEIEGTIQAHDAEGIRIDTYVVDRPCSIGPEGDPDGWLAHDTQRPGDPNAGDNATLGYGKVFDVRVEPAREYAAIAAAHADNTIGPIFGECKTFRAVPTQGALL